ncbi:MAG TPA: cytochrome d ubiquinol oxidase subunit II [Candidatus Baltobacteraceae bacterium]|nr:cytochrome d ubiquinol oxidase subunit II [Candidatus Baltobacteraceae bacterium]
MSVAAFWLVAVMLTVYVVLDGYDLGVGSILHLYGRTPRERGAAIASVGPYANGNEVWLIAAAGSLFGLFPHAFASAFSGFYLPLMLVLWLFIGRGMALELRSHFNNDLWREFWDWIFALSSALLAIVFGVALGNLVRGLPVSENAGLFKGSFSLLLNAYALAVGVLGLLALSQHGLRFLNLRLPDGAERRRPLATTLWWSVLVVFLGVSVASLLVHPLAGSRLAVSIALGLIALAALSATKLLGDRGLAGPAFAASSAYIASLVVTAAATIFPYIVPAYGGRGGISIFEQTPSPVSFGVFLGVIVVALSAVVAYSIFVQRSLTGPVTQRP